ncbi:hypothetical protein QCA50_000072 [Cerrena zonata]|uniref:Uncharacterized protein n=1 Tax=Cerrena zonata TaxID=2478898 RepID=A0AAW0GPM4_9APHY
MPPIEDLATTAGSSLKWMSIFATPPQSINWKELNLRSKMNVLTVRLDVFRLLQSQAIVFPPTIPTLERIYQLEVNQWECPMSQRHRLFDHLPDQEYEYILVPLKADADLPPLYLSHPHIENGYVQFNPPYKGFPRLKSRVHPLFMVHRMTFSLFACDVRAPKEIHDAMFKVYDLWMPAPNSFCSRRMLATSVYPPNVGSHDKEDLEEYNWEDDDDGSLVPIQDIVSDWHVYCKTGVPDSACPRCAKLKPSSRSK